LTNLGAAPDTIWRYYRARGRHDREETIMKKNPAKRGASRSTTRAPKDLAAASTSTVRAGADDQVFSSVSTVLKTRHDTVTNSISNIR
jgi:hypothetical protein